MARTLSGPFTTQKNLKENRPVELHEMYLDAADGGTQYYCNHKTAITFPTGGQVYSPLGSGRSNVSSSIGLEIASVAIQKDDVSLALSSLLASNVQFGGRKYIIKEIFLDAMAADDYIVRFEGEMQEPQVDGKTAAMEIIGHGALRKLKLPRRTYGSGCPWTYGVDAECGETAITKAGTVDAGCTRRTIDCSDIAGDYADRYFEKGTLTIGGESRVILTFTGGTLAVTPAQFIVDYGFTTAPAVGVVYSAKQGCDNTPDMCRNVYANMANFAGFTTIPGVIIKRSTQKME